MVLNASSTPSSTEQEARTVPSYRSLQTTIALRADRAMRAAFTPAHPLLEVGNQRPVGAKREGQLLSATRSCL